MKVEAIVDDLYRVENKAAIIHGEIVTMPPTGGLPGYAVGEILSNLRSHAVRHKFAHGLGGNVAFIVNLPHRKSFCPDAAYHVGRLSMKFVQGAPRFAVEVRSEGDYGPVAEKEMAEKRADYFAAGTLVVWDVDLLGADIVRVYRAERPDAPTVYHRGETAEAEAAVPGWTMPVDDLFPRD